MKPSVLALLIIALTSVVATTTLAAQSSGPIHTREGDTLTIIEHHVPAASRPGYEQWMTNVWWPAAHKVAEKYPDYAPVLAARRRFVPLEPSDTGMATYVFLYPVQGHGGEPETKHHGLAGTLEESGMPEAEIDRRMKAFDSLGVKLESFDLVQREYRKTP